MLKLAALAGLGYAGYKYYQKNGNPFDKSASNDSYSGVNRTIGGTSSGSSALSGSSATGSSTSPTGGSSSFSDSPSLKTS
ncbi:hypothetical protein [Porphyrobacter sp. GA68]|uniref:hypothetical protein n=1 Tax=Porphyrobacter sp. GA68 TaxID=2883480 RepID=UPI001D17F9AD|nr:hypothetical protein [Porphyrobacter sp. GA68]